MGPDSLEIFNSFNEDLDVVKYDKLIEKLEAYFLPKVNIVMERHKFFTRSQRDGESIDEYITVLKNLSLSCDFKDLREDLVRDIFVCGLNNNFSNIKEKLLNEGGIKFDKAIDIAKTMEATKGQAQQLQLTSSNNSNNVIAAIHRSSSKSQNHQHTNTNNSSSSHFNKNNIRTHNSRSSSYVPSQRVHNKTQNCSSSYQKRCYKCGEIHRSKCPALGVRCNNCKRMNHFAKMCKNKNAYIRNVDVSSDYDELSEDTAQLFIGMMYIQKAFAVSSSSEQADRWIVPIHINGASVQCQIDTGAQANIKAAVRENKQWS